MLNIWTIAGVVAVAALSAMGGGCREPEEAAAPDKSKQAVENKSDNIFVESYQSLKSIISGRK